MIQQESKREHNVITLQKYNTSYLNYTRTTQNYIKLQTKLHAYATHKLSKLHTKLYDLHIKHTHANTHKHIQMSTFKKPSCTPGLKTLAFVFARLLTKFILVIKGLLLSLLALHYLLIDCCLLNMLWTISSCLIDVLLVFTCIT